MQLPADLRAMLEAVRRVGRPRLVGGGVRDWLLGLPSKDFDVEVAGVDFEALHRALARFGATDVVGRSFGVIKVRSAGGAEYDFSLPRRESKTGAGHRGFAVAPDPGLSDAEAKLDALRGFADPARILFGTDYPYVSEDVAIAETAGLDAYAGFSDGERKMVARGNAEALFARLKGKG